MSVEILDRSAAPRPGPVKPFDFPLVYRKPIDGDAAPDLLIARHGDLPLVTVHVLVEGGAEAELPDQAGLARLTAAALEAGTDRHDVESLAWELESLGVELESSSSWDSAYAGITVATERLDPALALLAEVVRRPRFPADQVERLRDQQVATILQRRKEPRALADRAAAHFIFRDGVPYGRPQLGLERTVEALDRDDLERFHQRRYRAGSAAIIVTGAIEPDQASERVRAHFGDWRGAPAEPPSFDVAPRVESTTVFIVHRPGSVQSEIRLGHVGVSRHHDDYFSLQVMNTLLGGAFTSRLNMNLRERHGFTYAARSGFSFRRRPGPFNVDVAVATDVTARALEEAFTEIRGLRSEGPTDEELDNARDYLRGILPLRLQTTDQLAAQLSEIHVYGLSDDYFRHYRDRIARVTKADAHRVAREAVRPDAMAVVVVGDAEQIEAPIRELGLGDVHVLDSVP